MLCRIYEGLRTRAYVLRVTRIAATMRWIHALHSVHATAVRLEGHIFIHPILRGRWLSKNFHYGFKWRALSLRNELPVALSEKKKIHRTHALV